jgi:hypothetical protein
MEASFPAGRREGGGVGIGAYAEDVRERERERDGDFRRGGQKTALVARCLGTITHTKITAALSGELV